MGKGKTRGYVTFQEANAYLPDEGGSPLLVDDLVLALDEYGLNLIEDPSIPRPASSVSPGERIEVGPDGERIEIVEEAPSSALSSRDPVRMYLSQMGNIPLL